jgi:hypothetical protein
VCLDSKGIFTFGKKEIRLWKTVNESSVKEVSVYKVPENITSMEDPHILGQNLFTAVTPNDAQSTRIRIVEVRDRMR